MRTVESAVVGLALAVVVAGTVLGVLVMPPFTQILIRRLDIAMTSGVPPAVAEDLAERVRVFVTDRSSPALPPEVDGTPAFGEDAVAHLEDVREVMLAARTATAVLAVALAAWLVFSMVRKRTEVVASALIAGAVWCVALPVLGAALGVLDFDAFFAAFHAVFFESGTWTFPADSMLIRLFPERFWATAAASWAAGILFGAVMLGSLAVLLRRNIGPTTTALRDASA